MRAGFLTTEAVAQKRNMKGCSDVHDYTAVDMSDFSAPVILGGVVWQFLSNLFIYRVYLLSFWYPSLTNEALQDCIECHETCWLNESDF